MKSALFGDGQAPIKRPEDFLVFHWPHYQHGRHSTPDTTILADGWKLHYWWETDAVQLFHLDQDLGESKDLATNQVARATGLKQQLTNYLTTIHAQLPLPNLNYRATNAPVSNAADDKE